MMEQDNCKRLLELALDIEIEHVEVDTEKSIVCNPEYKGVRLDVFARGEIPESLRSRIMSIKDNRVLRQLLKYAVQATTISEFDSMMNL